MTEVQGAMSPPKGVVPNFEHPEDVLNTVNIVTQGLCIPIVSIFVALRLWIKIRVKNNIGIEDYFCIIAWLLFMGYCTTGVLLSEYGGGYHQWEVRVNDAITFRKVSYVATILYAPMAFFVKVALLSILTRVFAPLRNTMILIYVILGFLLCFYIPCLIIKIRICMPISTYWLGLQHGGSCLDQRAVIISDSVMSVFSDLVILVLPLPLTWSLQMPRNKKFRVMGLLCAGGLATGFSLWRLVMIIQDGSSPDQTMVFTRVVLSGNAEGGVGLICACLPALNTLFTSVNTEYSSKTLESSCPEHELSKMRASDRGSGARTSKTKASYADIGSDQVVLISDAQGASTFETDSRGDSESGAHCIRKTVNVSHSVDYVR